MYDELVATLRRQCAEMDCGNCNTCVLTQAADAIEELTMIAESYMRSMNAWADTAAKAVEQIPEWTPVSKRPPEMGQKVLIFWKEAGEPVEDTAFWKGEWAATHWANMGDKVTHWMSMPKPPKEEN